MIMSMLLTGCFEGIVDFNPSSIEEKFTSSGRKDVFMLKLDIDGKYIWNKTFGGNGNEKSYALCTDQNNNIFILGTFTGRTDFKYSEGKDIIKSKGNKDVFLTKIKNNAATFIENVVPNNIYFHPNPTMNTLKFKNIDIKSLIVIKDINESIALKPKINKNKIDISTLGKSMYIISLKWENQIITKKITKL